MSAGWAWTCVALGRVDPPPPRRHRAPRRRRADRRDIVRAIVDLVRQTGAADDVLLAVEVKIRAEWGGQRVDVWKTFDGKRGRPARKAP